VQRSASAVRRSLFVGLSIAVIGGITFTYVKVVQPNPTTVALTYLVAILLMATEWGIVESMTASIAAMLCFNFFFLPPVGTLTIADPQNWIALLAFSITAVVASQLSARARQRNIEALARQRDLERLYALSRALLLTPENVSIQSAIAPRIAEAFELPAVALYDQQSDVIALGGHEEVADVDRKLRVVARQGASLREDSGLVVTAIGLGGQPIGSLAIIDTGLSDTVLQSIANLAAIGLERARGQAAAARAEAARQSGELRAAVLDALAHEFKTPLTSMKAAASDLMPTAATARERELVAIIDEDLDRLQALVTDAVQMLRIDAGDFVVHRDRHALADIVARAVKKIEPRLDGHQVIKRVPPDLAVVADADLLGLALRQLIDNAIKYSPPSSTIEIEASSNGAVDLIVRNSGSVIADRDQPHLFERFYRGGQARRIPGTGMGLSIVQQIAHAHGGSVAVTSTPTTGTAFAISLPREDGTA
jgi:two-component system sensor histidine kinase KdpD